MTQKEAARVILLAAINRVLDLKPVSWCDDGLCTAEPAPDKQDWAWRVYERTGNGAFESYKPAKDVIARLVEAKMVGVD